MSTQAQLESFDASEEFTSRLQDAALLAIRNAAERGATADEAYRLAFPGRVPDHGSVDAFRVAIRALREQGLIKDSKRRRESAVSGRTQTVWVEGDDRDQVERQRRAKLKKFETSWLVAELRRRGLMVVEPKTNAGRLF